MAIETATPWIAFAGEASYADTTPEYKTCVAACRAEGCPRILEVTCFRDR